MYLIEITSFSKKSILIKNLQSMLNETMKKNNIKFYKIIRKEYGIILWVL